MLFDKFLVLRAVDPYSKPKILAHRLDIVRMYAKISVVFFGKQIIIIRFRIFTDFFEAFDVDIIGNRLSAVADLESRFGKQLAERVVVPRDGSACVAKQYGNVHIRDKIESMRGKRFTGQVVLDLAAAEI